MHDCISMLPTPPRTKDRSIVVEPTPPSSHGAAAARRVDGSMLPTPEMTVRSKKRVQHIHITHEAASGTTTNDRQGGMDVDDDDDAPPAHDGMIIVSRRPGLTFAQQMGLLAANAQTHSQAQGAGRPPTTTTTTAKTSDWTSTFPTSASSSSLTAAATTSSHHHHHGLGVGMGGSKRSSLKRHDSGLLVAAPICDASADENPFLDSQTSSSIVGASTAAAAAAADDDDDDNGNDNGMDVDVYASPPHQLLQTPNSDTISLASSTVAAFDKADSTSPVRTAQQPAAEGLLLELGKRRKWAPPVRGDEVDNPFLASAERSDLSNSSRRRHPAKSMTLGGEKPTIDYVFRGTKTTFANPYYGRDHQTEASLLPVSHPDFSPAPVPKPRLLFPQAMAAAAPAARSASKLGANNDADAAACAAAREQARAMLDEEDENEGGVLGVRAADLDGSRKLLFRQHHHQPSAAATGVKRSMQQDNEEEDVFLADSQAAAASGRDAKRARNNKTGLHRL